jgi:hypothetical protein
MKFYNSIPTEIKPSLGASQLRYADSFDSGIAFLLRERISNTLGSMMIDAIKVYVNLIALRKIKQNFDRNGKKPQGYIQPSMSQSSNKSLT